jgi:CubicO group peptidase (beta-lactamase class C family)
MPGCLRPILRPCLALLLIAELLPAQSPMFPGKEWERVADPKSAGYSTALLAVLHTYLATLDTTAMMAVSGGHVVFEYGDTPRLSYVASARKRVLAMLYGNYVASGKIRLDRKLRDLQFNDLQGLLRVEREATVEHLIAARSGIYHPASNAGDSTALAPPRGSRKPGSYLLYNNWDFNAAGAVFEQMTGKDIYDALQSDLAQPIGMQHFDRERQKKSGDPQRSKYLACHMWLSTRDMARVGYLMLREGNGAGRQVMPRDWTRKIVSLVTPLAQLTPLGQGEAAFGDGMLWGYEDMWWVARHERGFQRRLQRDGRLWPAHHGVAETRPGDRSQDRSPTAAHWRAGRRVPPTQSQSVRKQRRGEPPAGLRFAAPITSGDGRIRQRDARVPPTLRNRRWRG